MGCVGMRNDFTLFSRKDPSGDGSLLLRYDDDGERLGPWSTGQATKTAARNYCSGLIRSGLLVPGIKELAEYRISMPAL